VNSDIASQCKHHKNLRLYVAKPRTTMLEQVNNYTSKEVRRKRVQFATLFQILSDGQLMLEYESHVSLYKFFAVQDMPAAHWCDTSS